MSGGNLDPELDWSLTTRSYAVRLGSGFFETAIRRAMQRFFDPFTPRKSPGGLAFLHDYQRVGRFGGTALSIATLLCLMGLLVGSPRSRVGVLLLGVGGLTLLVAPVLTVWYVGRYSVPLAAPITAGAATAVWGFWQVLSSRRNRRQDAAFSAAS